MRTVANSRRPPEGELNCFGVKFSPEMQAYWKEVAKFRQEVKAGSRIVKIFYSTISLVVKLGHILLWNKANVGTSQN